ncbi:glycoside hydrolase family 17 protein [Hypoxylon sp. FL1284]|nr:glycoside hydrolase family 17 protein [Hypoxylon sp. FL1284]
MRSTTVSVSFLYFLPLAAGQQRHNHAHRHRSNKPVIKRDRITITDSTRTTPTEVPEIVIYVDQYNNLMRTATETVVYVPITAETPEVAVPETSTVYISPVPSRSAPAEDSTSVVSPPTTPISQGFPTIQPPPPIQSDPTSTSLPTPSVSPPTTSNSSSLYGVTYSPYKGTGLCKTADEVDADFAAMARDYGVIRLYGVDCDQVATAYSAAKKYGNKLFLGIFDLNTIDPSVATIAAGVQNDWSIVDTVSVGNELVNDGRATVGQSLGALSQTRSSLRAAGYQGPVVVVDTFVAMLAHPELCDQSDYCAMNVHPFFDPNTGPRQAGWFVTSIVKKMKSRLSDPYKRVVVTETGWPWQGESNGVAVPGMSQQSIAISSIKSAYADNPSDVVLFTAFNDMWKKPAAGTFMAEQFWGMGGRYSSSDESNG